MHRRKLSALIMLATTFNFSAQTIDVFASEIKEDIKLSRSISNEENGDIQLNQAKISKFDLLNSSYLEEYNKVFKLDNSKIISITEDNIHHQTYIKLLMETLVLIGKQEKLTVKPLKMK